MMARLVPVVSIVVSLCLQVGLSQAKSSGKKAYVLASVANIRQAPMVGGELVAKLPIGSELMVSEEKDGWAQVKSGEIVGWVGSALITDKQPTLWFLTDKFLTSRNDKEKRVWAERAAALEPQKLQPVIMLINVLKKLGDKRALAQAERGLRGLREARTEGVASELKNAISKSSKQKVVVECWNDPHQDQSNYGVYVTDPCVDYGDFDDDGKRDSAVLVKNINNKQTGMGVVHGNGKVSIIAAGTCLEVTGGHCNADLSWMDYWNITSMPTETNVEGKAPPKRKGDAFLFGKLESASSVIYWNGKEFVWFQQGD